MPPITPLAQSSTQYHQHHSSLASNARTSGTQVTPVTSRNPNEVEKTPPRKSGESPAGKWWRGMLHTSWSPRKNKEKITPHLETHARTVSKSSEPDLKSEQSVGHNSNALSGALPDKRKSLKENAAPLSKISSISNNEGAEQTTIALNDQIKTLNRELIKVLMAIRRNNSRPEGKTSGQSGNSLNAEAVKLMQQSSSLIEMILEADNNSSMHLLDPSKQIAAKSKSNAFEDKKTRLKSRVSQAIDSGWDEEEIATGIKPATAKNRMSQALDLALNEEEMTTSGVYEVLKRAWDNED